MQKNPKQTTGNLCMDQPIDPCFLRVPEAGASSSRCLCLKSAPLQSAWGPYQPATQPSLPSASQNPPAGRRNAVAHTQRQTDRAWFCLTVYTLMLFLAETETDRETHQNYNKDVKAADRERKWHKQNTDTEAHSKGGICSAAKHRPTVRRGHCGWKDRIM